MMVELILLFSSVFCVSAA